MFSFLKKEQLLPDKVELYLSDRFVDVFIKHRSSAKRMTLRVSSATGQTTLTLPPRTQWRKAQSFIHSHSGWIEAKLAKLPDNIPFEEGALIPVRGSLYRIYCSGTLRGLTSLSMNETGEPIMSVPGSSGSLSRRVKDYLKQQASIDLGEAVAHYTKSIGIPAKKITLRDTRSRWGSCSAQGHLNFSWRLILAPAFVLDYLAAHEVAHLKEMNHSKKFWDIVYKICPHTDKAEAWLKRHGSTLHRYG